MRYYEIKKNEGYRTEIEKEQRERGRGNTEKSRKREKKDTEKVKWSVEINNDISPSTSDAKVISKLLAYELYQISRKLQTPRTLLPTHSTLKRTREIKGRGKSKRLRKEGNA
jgi:hypothetical protein